VETVIRLAVLCLVLALPLPAAADCYAVDPAAGRVSFEVSQAGAPFRGVFRRFGGKLCIEGAAVSRIDVWLDPASVDTGLPEIDAALKEKEFFAAAQYPRIAFAGQGDAARARGTFEIKGKRGPADVPFRLVTNGGKQTVSGTFMLDRLQYGIGTGDWSDTRWVGKDVKVEFSARLSPAN